MPVRLSCAARGLAHNVTIEEKRMHSGDASALNGIDAERWR
jgi:hypothetical protein